MSRPLFHGALFEFDDELSMVASVEPTTPSEAPADRSAMQSYRNDRLCRGFGHSALDIIQLNLPPKMVYRGGCGSPWMMSARPLSLVIADRGRATSIIKEGAIKWSISLVWTCR